MKRATSNSERFRDVPGNMIRAKIKTIEITEAPDLNPNANTPDDVEVFGCT